MIQRRHVFKKQTETTKVMLCAKIGKATRMHVANKTNALMQFNYYCSYYSFTAPQILSLCLLCSKVRACAFCKAAAAAFYNGTRNTSILLPRVLKKHRIILWVQLIGQFITSWASLPALGQDLDAQSAVACQPQQGVCVHMCARTHQSVLFFGKPNVKMCNPQNDLLIWPCNLSAIVLVSKGIKRASQESRPSSI